MNLWQDELNVRATSPSFEFQPEFHEVYIYSLPNHVFFVDVFCRPRSAGF
jgi:hypothetical protein